MTLQFQSGNEVLLHTAQGETEAFLAATVLHIKDNGDVHIKFASPNFEGESEDIVDPADLSLASESTEGETLLERALDCVNRGWFVFPCRPRSKEPATTQGFLDASNDTKQVREWWTKNPEYNIAIALGPSGLVVYDFDEIKPFEDLPPTFTVRTGRIPVNGVGGTQLYYAGSCRTHTIFVEPSLPIIEKEIIDSRGKRSFQRRDSLNRLVGQKGVAVGEVRSRGAYVMAPGSVHPSGNVYEIISNIPLVGSPEQNQEAMKPSEPAIGTQEQEKKATYLEEAFDASGIKYKNRVAYQGGFKWLIVCPWDFEHSKRKDLDSSSAVIMWPSGMFIYECKHAHCDGIREWKELRAWMEGENGANHPLSFGDPVGGVTIGGAGKVQTVSIEIYNTQENQSSPTPVPAPAVVSVLGQILPPQDRNFESIPPFDTSIITGFYSDVVEFVTRGNTLPPQFVYGIAKTLVGARCAGITKFKTTTAEARYYLALLGQTGSGKGESWRRTMAALRSSLSADIGIKLYDSADSGAGLKESFFADPLGQPVLVYVDEVADLGFKSQANKNPEILTSMVTLAEGTSITRLLAKERRSREDARLSVVMCGQPDIYPASFTGIKGGLLGWYDRLTPEFATKPDRVTDLAPLDGMEAYKLYEAFNNLPYATEIDMSTPAQRLLDDYWNALLLEDRIVRRRKNILIDAYMGAFGRRAKEVEKSDVLVALRLFERQQSIRFLHFNEEIPDRVGFYQSKIKKIMEKMADELASGKPPEMVRKTRRHFEKYTNAYGGNEGHYFQKAWAVFAPVYLNRIEETNKMGGKVEYFLPKWRN
jgi:hypothetical protein